MQCWRLASIGFRRADQLVLDFFLIASNHCSARVARLWRRFIASYAKDQRKRRTLHSDQPAQWAYAPAYHNSRQRKAQLPWLHQSLPRGFEFKYRATAEVGITTYGRPPLARGSATPPSPPGD